MKKLSYFLLSFLICGTLLIGVHNNTKKAHAEDNEVSYVADFSNGKPTDWQAYSKGTNSAPCTASSDGFVINNTSDAPAEAKYYGKVFLIDVADEGVGNFELEMQARALSYKDSGRWFGILYHTKLNDDSKLSSYMMNYRINGRTAQSTITASPKFNDSLDVSGFPALSDKAYHTFKISCFENMVTHYVDGSKVHEYDFTKESEIAPQYTGQFGLIVNSLELEIKSFKVTGTKGIGVPDVDEEDLTMVDVYKPSNYTSISPVAVNTLATSKEDLEAIKASETKPSNTIIKLNSDMEVVDAENVSTGLTLLKAYEEYLQGTILNVYLSNENDIKPFVEYCKSKLYLLDMQIISDNPKVVEGVRQEMPHIRGVVDYSKRTDINTKEKYQEVVAESTKSWANTVILSDTNATYEAIYYIQARFKTVWVNDTNDSFDMFRVVKYIKNGVFGIVTNFFEESYGAYDVFYSKDVGKSTMTRRPYNAAHRGINSQYENSLEGCIDAVENWGATHIEIDAQVTKDDKIAIMHDETIGRACGDTSIGVGISSLTSDELANYTIKVNGAGERMSGEVHIPFLYEFFEYFKGKGTIVLLEIKNTNSKFASLLKDLLDEYDFYDQIVIISFHSFQLDAIRKLMPQIPIALLNQGTDWQNKNLSDNIRQLSSSNYTFSMNYSTNSSHSDEYLYNMGLRGYASWYWTSNSSSSEFNYYKGNIIGITGNWCSALQVLPFRIDPSIKYANAKNTNYSSLMLMFDYENYDGTMMTGDNGVVAGVQYFEEHDGYADAIFGGIVVLNTTDPASGGKISGNIMIYSDKIRVIVNMTLFADVAPILEKNVADVTESDMVILQNYVSTYACLYDEDKNETEYSQVLAFISEVENYEPVVESSEETSSEEVSSEISSEEIISSKSEEVVSSSESSDKPSGGCGGSVIATSSLIALVSLFGVILASKKKHN